MTKRKRLYNYIRNKILIYRLYYLWRIKESLVKKKFLGKSQFNQFLKIITPAPKDNMEVKTKLGFNLIISPIFDKGIERRIFEVGLYEAGTLWCFEKIIKKGDVFFDVGANIGLTAIHAGNLVGENGIVHAFEPMPSTFNILKKNIYLNKMKNIFPHNFGLTDFERKAVLFPNLEVNRGAASLFSKNKKDGVDIELKRLDDFLKRNKITKVDFIKVDIEGSEAPFLKGAIEMFSQINKPIICIEFSRDISSDTDPNFIFDFLKNLKYSIYKQEGGKESLTPLVQIKTKKELPQHDNLFCFQDYHFEFLSMTLFNRN